MASSPSTIIILFCHGAGFCREIWTPIITRLEHSPLLERHRAAGGHVELVTFDLPYHGANRDVSIAPTVYEKKPGSRRVSHPAMDWPTWSMAAVRDQVDQLRHDTNTHTIIGIGHSMGAAAMWGVEAKHPGTFAGLLLFEPTCLLHDRPVGADLVNDAFVAYCLKRTAQWDSREDAKKDIQAMRSFARWHPESMDAYVQGAVVRVQRQHNAIDPDATYALACHPQIEASFYTNELMRLAPDDVERVQCRITFHYGEDTMLFFPHMRQPLVDKYPNLYSIGNPVPKTTHTLVMEDIETVTSRIIDSLAELPAFATIESRL